MKSWFISNKERQNYCFQNVKENGDHKETLINKENENVRNQKVFGVKWIPNADEINFTVDLKLEENRLHGKKRQPNKLQSCLVPLNLTRRMILSQINGLFDPIGLASPFAIKAKILMRRLWIGKLKELGWDGCQMKKECYGFNFSKSSCRWKMLLSPDV